MKLLASVLWNVVLAVLASLLVPAAASAQDVSDQAPFGSDPKDLTAAIASIKVEPGTASVTLLSETRWTFEADGKADCRSWNLYKILNEDGVAQNATVSAEWSPWYQERPRIRARVITADGKVHPLNPETLSEQSLAANTPDVFTDRKSLTGPLPSLAIGAVVELEVVTKQTKPFFESGVTFYLHFGGGEPVQKQRVILDLPESMSIKSILRQMNDLKPRVETAAGRTVTTYVAGPFAAGEPAEMFAPPDARRSPYLAFTTGSSWNQVAKRYHEIVEAQIADSGLDLLGELPAKDLPVNARIARILSLIQARVRYTSLAFGEASIVPRPPAETLKRGYGDCKDKSALLVAALRKAGIEAHVAVLLTGPGPEVEPDLPGFGAFDHAIVRVATMPPLWIDPTDKFARPGALPVQDQDRLALIAASSTEALTRTPSSAPADNFDLKIREVRLADFGPASLVETRRPTGYSERNLRSLVEQEKKSLDKSLETYAKNVFMAEKVARSSFTDPNDLTKPMEMVLELTGVGRGQTDLREAVVAVPLANLLADLPWLLRAGEIKDVDGKPWRKTDVVLSLPYIAEWRYRITPPPGFHPRAFPNSEKIALGPASLLKEFKSNDDGSVSAVFRFDCGRRRLTPEEAREVHTAAQKLEKDGMLLIGFVQVGTAHLEAGRVREALAEFRTLAEAHPRTALYQALIARGLLAGGLGDAARGVARKAVELDKDSAVAQETLGWVLEHDLIGRRLQKGWDPKGAAEAYRAALKIRPGHLQNTLELAILLEHDETGQRYSPGTHLKEAVDLYKSVAKEIEGTAFEHNLNFDLLWSTNFSELQDRLQNPANPTAQMMLAISKAALEGTDASLAHVARTIASEETRQQVLAQGGEHLLKLRYYPEAAAFLSAGARGAANAANLLGRADRLRKTRRWDGTPPPATDPGSTVKRLLYYLMTPRMDLDAMKALMSRYVHVETNGNVDEGYKAMRTGLQEIFNKQGVPLAVGQDLTLSLLDPTIEGDAAFGYRVRVPPAFGAGNVQLWYLRTEEGTLRLFPPGDGSLARMSLDLLEAGDKENALKWLTWASEELGDGADREPLEAAPFAMLWKSAKDGDAKSLKLAAAALAVEGGHCEKAVGALEEARNAADLDHRQAYWLDHALFLGYSSLDRSSDAAAAALKMMEDEPEADLAVFYRNRALDKLRKWEDLIELCQAQLRKKPNNLSMLRTLMHAEAARGNFAASREHALRLLKSGRPDAFVYNGLAWGALIEGKIDDATLQNAQKGVESSQGRSDACLHTLATVYADLGRPIEARDVLLQTFRSRSSQEPEDHDWYVLGRIAEEYGARDAAIEAYRRTAKSSRASELNDTNQLSLRRLKILEERK